MTIRETLKAISGYPIPARVLDLADVVGHVNPLEEVTAELLQTVEYLRGKESVLTFLVSAPNAIGEMGVSYRLGDSERSELRKQLNEVRNKIGLLEGKPYKSTGFGSIGEAL